MVATCTTHASSKCHCLQALTLQAEGVSDIEVALGVAGLRDNLAVR